MNKNITRTLILLLTTFFSVSFVTNIIADEVDDMNLMRSVALQLNVVNNNSTAQAAYQAKNQPSYSTNPQLQQVPEYVEPPENSDLFTAATNGDVQEIASLLVRGLNVNSSNSVQETALHMATAHGHYSAVIYLINHGANINARTIKNWIPLHHAVRFKHPNIVNYLMQRGSSANARTSDGYSAVDMAKSTQDYRILSLLGVR